MASEVCALKVQFNSHFILRCKLENIYYEPSGCHFSRDRGLIGKILNFVILSFGYFFLIMVFVPPPNSLK